MLEKEKIKLSYKRFSFNKIHYKNKLSKKKKQNPAVYKKLSYVSYMHLIEFRVETNIGHQKFLCITLETWRRETNLYSGNLLSFFCGSIKLPWMIYKKVFSTLVGWYFLLFYYILFFLLLCFYLPKRATKHAFYGHKKNNKKNMKINWEID